jgi:hypothetical protein
VRWRLDFQDGSVEVLPRMHSDHSPLLLRCCPNPNLIINKPFRFEAAWIYHPQFAQVVDEAWRKGSPIFTSSLGHVREDAQRFNREVFGNIFWRKKRIADQIHNVQQRLEKVDSVVLTLRLKELYREQ